MCWDKAAAENFFAALKNEMYHQRLHSALGYCIPAEVLTKLQNAAFVA